MYDTAHAADDNTQETWLNVPPMLLSFQDTMPDGVTGELELSAIVVVSWTWVPGFIVSEFDVIVSVTGCNVVALIVEMLELLECVPSPP